MTILVCKIVAGILLALILVATYCCLVVAGRADDKSNEEM